MSPARPDIQVVRRVVAVVTGVLVLALALVLPEPPEQVSELPPEHDYRLAAAVPPPPDDGVVAVGEDVAMPTGHLARVAAVEVHAPAQDAPVPAATVEVGLELRVGEPTNLHAREPVVAVRLDEVRRFRAEPRCPGDDLPRRPRVTGDEPARSRVCVRVPQEALDDLRLELAADLADGSQQVRWQVELEPSLR